jgi:hypothetical protein
MQMRSEARNTAGTRIDDPPRVEAPRDMRGGL